MIFVCSDDIPPAKAPEGLEYTIEAKGLSPNTKYIARAYPLLGSTDYPDVSYYELGTIKTNKEGEGKVSGFVDLDSGFFNYLVTVELDGTTVLTTLPPFTYYDPALDLLPFPVGRYLWFAGDSIDGFAVE